MGYEPRQGKKYKKQKDPDFEISQEALEREKAFKKWSSEENLLYAKFLSENL